MMVNRLTTDLSVSHTLRGLMFVALKRRHNAIVANLGLWQLFSKHQHVLMEHLNTMIAALRQCEQGSGNFLLAKECVDQTNEMLRTFKVVAKKFVGTISWTRAVW